jgi:hypothetical protein
MTAPAIAPRTCPTFNSSDRCDRCGARAKVQVILPSGGELVFCIHHGRRYELALLGSGADFRTIVSG